MPVFELQRNADALKSDAVIGIYYPNGVFSETKCEAGISYMLDHMIFEQLQMSISDKGYGRIQGYTYYGYSSFLIQCKTKDIYRNLEWISKVLYDDSLYYEDVLDWIASRRFLMKNKPTPIEQKYYAVRLGRNPLAKTLSHSMGNAPPLERLEEWRKKFVCKEQVACYITSRDVSLASIDCLPIFFDSVLPHFKGNRSDLPRHIPWPYSRIIYTIPFLPTAENILEAEICCEILKRRVSPIIRKNGGRLDSIKICPDYISEIRIQFQAFKGTPVAQVKELGDFVANLSPISQREYEKAYCTIRNTYNALVNDQFEWNKFLGYNSLSGNRYDVNKLSCSGVTSTIDAVERVFMAIRNQTESSVFATALY